VTEQRGRHRLLIVDDHQLFNDGLIHLLRVPDYEVVGTARTIAESSSQAATCRPDIVLVDYLLPDGDGVQAIDALRSVAPEVKVLIVTALDDDATLAASLDAGCDGFVTKDRAAEDLLDALDVVSRGDSAIRADQVARALAHLRRRPSPIELTTRETEVVTLLAEGLSNAAIGQRLAISTNTVRNHVQSLLSKLGVRSRLEAVAVATREGLISGAATPA
jgi:DNA-binding NarL/FixJ family response regulator